MAGNGNSDGGWPNGWLIAAVAGVIAAILARWIGDTGMAAAVLAGIFVFLVFGVLLGMFWGAPAAGGHDDGHGAGHSHDDGRSLDHGHGHDDGHGHAPVAAAPVLAVAPVAAAVTAPASAPMMAAPVASAPVASEPAAPVVSGEAFKPGALSGPRDGKGDDLQVLEGIGPGLEKLCHELGIFHFDQIAAWGAGEIAWMDGNLKGFKGRVSRDKWVRQAKLIGEVGVVEFLRRAKTNDY